MSGMEKVDGRYVYVMFTLLMLLKRTRGAAAALTCRDDAERAGVFVPSVFFCSFFCQSSLFFPCFLSAQPVAVVAP
ncbi:MAG: hypothetical protein ACAI35_26390 [Candidatus Methylacidiphilales bacterium]